MTEGTTDVVDTDTTAQPTPPLVSADGELRDGWRDTLPEDIRGEKVFDRVSNFEGVMKSLASAERMVGKDKIPIPNEASSEADWDTFYTAGGRPQAVTDYGFARPEKLPEEHWNQEYADGIQDILWKFGGSKKLADALFEFNNNFTMGLITKGAQDAELAATELQNGLNADWGGAFEQKKHLGNIAVEQGTNGNAEFKERLTQKFGNDPDFIRFASNVGSKFAEAGSIKIDEIPTPGDIQEQIDAAQGNPAYGADFAKHGFTKAQHKQQVNLVQQLFNKKMTSERKTG